jgi:EpsI family protein
VLPAPPAGWRPVAPGQETWRPTVVGADSEAVSAYQVGSARVLLHVAYYARQREGAEIISPANTLSDETSWRRVAAGPASVLLDGRAVSVRHARLRSTTKNLIVWQWYWVDGRFTGNPYVAKALRAKVALIGGGREAAIVTVAVEYADGDATVVDPVRTFVDKLAPFGAIFGRAQPNN